MPTICCDSEYKAIKEITLGGKIKKAHLIFNYPDDRDVTCSVLEIEPAPLLLVNAWYKTEAQARTIINDFIESEAEKAGFEYFNFRFASSGENIFHASMF